jgi:hypothetical protein
VQAIEKTLIDTNWITLLLLFLFVCVFLLKGLSYAKLKGNVFSFANNSFIDAENEEKTSFFNLFQSVIFLFSMVVLSLLIYKILRFYEFWATQDFTNFMKVLSLVSAYFLVKWSLEFVFSHVLMIQKQVRFFLISKAIYLYSTAFFLLISLVLVQYSQLNILFLIYFSIFIFSVRFVLHVIINKNLVFNELFYFILYLCAFEIAPLFILFKLMF